ncbi:MAG: homocysteine S-methyltransferase family protein [Acetivibrio sp.]
MTKQEFLNFIESKIIILDGATGSNLMEKGMTMGECPEKWILENPQVLISLQQDFIEAGSDILYAPTFTCNRIKLQEYGLEDNLKKMNAELVNCTKQAILREKEKGLLRPVYIAGDITMTGKQLYPIGTLLFEELVEIYKEQVKALVEAGVDLFVVETMMSLQECRAAVLAVKETCDLPVMVTLTFKEDMRTLYGTDPATAAVVMEAMGVEAVGVNCSTGPEAMCHILEKMEEYTQIPLIGKPNAGLPYLRNGITVYDMEAESFAKEASKLIKAGASIIGGCCGTTPKHISLLKKEVEKETIRRKKNKKRLLTTERGILEIKLNGSFLVIGERINPTGKKALQEELKENKLDLVVKMAEEQEEQGASILDINMGMNGIDENKKMQEVIYEMMKVSNLPLSIDSSYISVIENALRIYPGRALINSISLEKEKFEKLIPMAKKYGAMFVLLPLSDKGLPKNIEEKKEIIHKIVKRAYEVGLTKEDMVVDGLVTTVGANKKAALETLEIIRYCKEELEIATVCGLSNISFGLPERTFVNSTFLAFAIKEGLTMAIANPSQELLMNAAFASDLLLNKEQGAARYISRVSKHPLTISPIKTTAKTEEKEEEKDPIYSDVLKGNSRNILEDVKAALAQGESAADIIEKRLISGINETGELFDRQIYFLPQLISSAETMKIAIDYLEPLLKKEGTKKKMATLVMATVAGDIHDIGKNLVVLMLKNYGFDVIDLGKDVPAKEIIRIAKEKKAEVIGLSALMTTTMMEMKQVVDLAKQENLKSKIIIGGAVITQSFADEIGADGYSKDAKEAVLLVKRLLGVE